MRNEAGGVSVTLTDEEVAILVEALMHYHAACLGEDKPELKKIAQDVKAILDKLYGA